MCGRYRLSRHSILEKGPAGMRAPNEYNVAPSQQVPTAFQILEGLHLTTSVIPTFSRWGFLPAGVNFKPQINARAETVATSRLFQRAFIERRCVVPANGFYEWKLQNGVKQPYYITAEDEFAFAGIYVRGAPLPTDHVKVSEPWTFAIITTAANSFMAGLHGRMPVMLRQEQWIPWVRDGGLEMLRPFAGEMKAWPVTRKMNNPRYNEPDCVEAIA